MLPVSMFRYVVDNTALTATTARQPNPDSGISLWHSKTRTIIRAVRLLPQVIRVEILIKTEVFDRFCELVGLLPCCRASLTVDWTNYSHSITGVSLNSTAWAPSLYSGLLGRPCFAQRVFLVD